MLEGGRFSERLSGLGIAQQTPRGAIFTVQMNKKLKDSFPKPERENALQVEIGGSLLLTLL
jgi:hypothetical protein